MILITGASRGIGKYLFEHFKKEGEVVYGTYKTTKPKAETGSYLNKVDVSNYKEVEQWIGLISRHISRLVLINCAGINYNSFAHKADIEKWREVISVNLIGTFNVIHALLPHMRDERYGRIINLSSVVSHTFVPGTSAYAASKAGLAGLIRSIALENAKKGITINNIDLGYFNIGMINEISQDFQEVIKSKIPSGDFGTPENILRAVKFLIEADYMTGTSININGGIY